MVNPAHIEEAEKFGIPDGEPELEQCELCLRYDNPDNLQEVCKVCQENAASYEITERDLKYLKEYMKNVLSRALSDFEAAIEPGVSDDLVVIKIAAGIVRLKIALKEVK